MIVAGRCVGAGRSGAWPSARSRARRASGGELRVSADVEANSLDAATVLHAALEATVDPREAAQHEQALIPDADLRAWSREAPSPSAEAWRQADRSDARWFWLAGLILLGVEHAIRSRREQPAAQGHADAA